MQFAGVFQTIVVGSGDYRLTGTMRGALDGPRGLQWSIACLDSGVRLGEGEILRKSEPQWDGFAVRFSVPQTGCEAQDVRLSLPARDDADRFLDGTIMFADLAIERAR